jgi:hypothetical protein
MVKFLLPPGATPYLPGDGLLPADLDGNRPPPDRSPNYFVGTQDDDGPYGAPFDAINVFQFRVAWTARPTASFVQSAQLPVAAFDSAFPCDPPGSRNCIPQPGTTQQLDILSYRQRPTWRLAYRNFGTYESLVTSQSVEARPGIAGMRWYELRRPGDHPFVHQQGTYAPDDGVHRWMGSIAQDKRGNMALGYSVSNATGRLPGDPLYRPAEQRPQRQLPLLVRQRVLRGDLAPGLADPYRGLPHAGLLTPYRAGAGHAPAPAVRGSAHGRPGMKPRTSRICRSCQRPRWPLG